MLGEFWYATDEGGRWRYLIRCASTDPHLRAEEAAEDYHSNHDGWESPWPVTFWLFDSEDGPPYARLTVDREAVPQFFVTACETTRDLTSP